MHFHKSWFLMAGLLSLAPTLEQQAAAEKPFRIGMAEVDITPPNGFPMAGYYFERLATGTHDPLKAKAIVFRGDGEEAALVVCDLIGIAVDLSTEVRRLASSRTGIPASNIVVSATHSHTAPDYTKNLYQYLANKDKHYDTAKEPYARKLIVEIVAAVVKAHSEAQPAKVEVGSARQQIPVSFNRRFVMKDGSVRTWMSLDQPDVVRAAGPIDPDVSMVLVRHAGSGQPLGLLSNFALHLDTTGGMLWSADYPFYIEQSLRKSLANDLVSIFATGTCGDINHVDPSRKERNKPDFIGNALATTIEGGVPKLHALKEPRLRVRHATVRVPLQHVSPEQIARARPLLLEARAGKKVDFYDLVTAYKTIMLDQLQHNPPSAKTIDLISWGLSHTWAGIGDHLPVDVEVIGLGDDVAMVFLPGEIFVDLGLAIKRASPFKTTLVVELSNCVETIYVPTRAAYAGGSYEVTNSALAPGAGEMLVESALRLLREVASSDSKVHKP